MRSLFFFLLFATFIQSGLAQVNPEHKIVFQLTSSDTLAHKALMKQLGNILVLSPTSKLEVVCHGPGLSMLVNQTSMVSKKVTELSQRGVDFMACQFSMKERKVSKEELIANAIVVPGGIIEIVQKQEQGWSYIKAGN